MMKSNRRNRKEKASKPVVLPALGLLTIVLAAALLLSGCSLNDMVNPVRNFFAKDAEAEEMTAPVISEDTLMYAQVNNAAGKALVKPDGEPLTVLVAYETATGGEPRINKEGVLETHANGEVMTYAPGSVVTGSDGTAETYAGGEPVTNLLGLAVKDENGEAVTRGAGEEITHGADDIVYDAQGERMTYAGEPYTYQAGEQKYNTDGELATYAVTIQKDLEGETMTEENGSVKLRAIELVTDEAGDPVITPDGEAETKQLDPQPPQQKVEPPFEEGEYYIHNVTSPYVFFSTPEVDAERINVVVEEGEDPEKYQNENGEGKVENLQLEILGPELTGIQIVFDAEGYAYFVIPETGKVLGYAGDLHNGSNILPVDKQTVIYPQYKYWDDPLGTVIDSQRWILEPKDADTYLIRSVADPSYVMMVDDTYGTQYANIMLWKEDNGEKQDLQKFCISGEVPRIENSIEAGTYFIRSGLSDWMLLSIGDGIYDDERNIYVYTSDQGDGQIFNIEYDDYGFAYIRHNDSTKVLTVRENEARDGQAIGQYEFDGENWQRWILDPATESEDGGFYIRSALNVSEVMDLIGGEARNQRPIQLRWNNDTYAQYWYFHDEAIPAPSDFETMDAYAQTYSSATNYLLMVDNWTNHVGVYQGSKGNWTNIYFWDCVTGKPSTPTVKGEYTINFKVNSFDGNTDSPAWYTVYYASSFYPAYFFHSIIYFQNTWDIMDATMGYNASHGCVRLWTDNAKWIYENIPIGTKVVSY